MKILIIGGNRFFGKKLAANLIRTGHDVTLLNRGQIDDGLGSRVRRIKCDRKDSHALQDLAGQQSWDIIFDQVCFDAHEAAAAVKIFHGKTPHYVFTSSLSVFELGADLKEEAFDPRNFSFSEVADPNTQYAEAKRQCEAVFFQQNQLPITAVRFPIVVGADDYTKRFQFHVEHVKNGEPIYFPNLEARMSMISSDDAAKTLEFFVNHPPVGPINAASPAPIKLADFIQTIERKVGKKARLLDHPNGKSHSPYGIPGDWFMNTRKLYTLGCMLSPIEEWLEWELGKLKF